MMLVSTFHCSEIIKKNLTSLYKLYNHKPAAFRGCLAFLYILTVSNFQKCSPSNFLGKCKITNDSMIFFNGVPKRYLCLNMALWRDFWVFIESLNIQNLNRCLTKIWLIWRFITNKQTKKINSAQLHLKLIFRFPRFQMMYTTFMLLTLSTFYLPLKIHYTP